MYRTDKEDYGLNDKTDKEWLQLYKEQIKVPP